MKKIMILMAAAVALAACKPVEDNAPRSVQEYREAQAHAKANPVLNVSSATPTVWIDGDTGCEYIVFRGSGYSTSYAVMARNDGAGKQMGCKSPE